ncbi:MAG: polysaccharide deacetylase family protein [Eubacteriales bacterium]
MKHGFYFRLTAVILLAFLIAAVSVYTAETEETGEGSVILLLYHNLVRDKLGDKDDGNYCTTDLKFEKDIRDALGMRYKSLNLADFYEENYDKSCNYFIITFDDGYLSNYTIAFPILKKLEVYGDIFVCTDSTELVNHFSWRQGQIMEDSGYVKLYSHTPEHQRMFEITLPIFKYQVKRSFERLSIKLAGKRYRMFAYPGGEYSGKSVYDLYKMGVVMQLVQTLPGEECGWDYNAFGLVRRYNISYNTDITEMFEKIKK